jgi:hypothetical protein
MRRWWFGRIADDLSVVIGVQTLIISIKRKHNKYLNLF